MRTIDINKIEKAVEDLCIKANTELRPDILKALKRPGRFFSMILKNAKIARTKKLAICQDTGMVIVFMKIGMGAMIKGKDLDEAVQRAVRSAYKKGSFRKSIVKDPILRGKPGYGPAILHIEPVRGNQITIDVLVKGFGSENVSQIKMFKPTASMQSIKKFIVEAVRAAGPSACPPFVIGIGIGGTLDHATLLSKKALLCPINKNTKLEREILSAINKLNIGPMGLGGKTTALGVNILTSPTHIAGLPVSINIGCHATRSAHKVL